MSTNDHLTNQFSNNLPLTFPALVVGLGGTGVGTLRYLRRRLQAEFGIQAEQEPELIQLLGVDTVPLMNDSPIARLHQHEYAYIGGFNASKVIENRQRFPQIDSWWDYSTDVLPLGYISTGARQLRVIGRLALFRRFNTYKNRLQPKLYRLSNIAEHQRSHQHGRETQMDVNLPLVFVVASICGGTGAGTFIDVVHHLRAHLQEEAKIVGILVLPSVFEEDIPALLQRRRIQANGYAALKELDYFQSGNTFTAQYPGEAEVQVPGRPFDFVYLVDRANERRFTIQSSKDAQQMIAHFIFQSTVSPVAREIWERDVNVTQEHWVTEQGDTLSVETTAQWAPPRYLSYSAFGTSGLVVNERANRTELLGNLSRSIREGLEGQAGQTSAEAQVGKFMEEINEISGQASKGMSNNKVDPVRIYKKHIHEFAQNLLFTNVTDQLKMHQLNGAGNLIYLLRDNYKKYLDAQQGQVPTSGQKDEQNLIKKIDQINKKIERIKTQTVIRGVVKRLFMPWAHNGTSESSTIELIEDERNRLIQTLDQLLLLRKGVVPPLHALFNQLISELLRCKRLLVDVETELSSRTRNRQDMLRFTQSNTTIDMTYALETFLPNGQETSAKLELGWIQEGTTTIMADLLQVRRDDNNAVSFLISHTYQAVTSAILHESARLLNTYYQGSSFLSHFQHLKQQESRTEISNFFNRCTPYCRMDLDRQHFPEENIERQFLVTLPSDCIEAISGRNSRLQHLFRDWQQYLCLPSHHNGRLDAVVIAHGYPISFLQNLPVMYTEYASSDMARSPLHLQCRWRWQMPNIHFPFDGEPQEPENLQQNMCIRNKKNIKNFAVKPRQEPNDPII